jgi:6-phosphofructokinase 1
LLPQDCCLIPESPFYLEGKRQLLEFIERRREDKGHVVIVLVEGTSVDTQDASGDKTLLDGGLRLFQKIKARLLVQTFVSFSIW